PDRILGNIDRQVGDPSALMVEKHTRVDEIKSYRTNCADSERAFGKYAACKFMERDRRVIQTKKSIGRLTYVHPYSGDLFYFIMLLSNQKGCSSPIEVRTINGKVLPTYRASCEALEFGILSRRRSMEALGKHSEAKKDDNPCKATLNGFEKFVKEFRLPTPPEHLLKESKNKLLIKEKNYRRDVLLQESALSVPKLNEEQKQIYNLIINTFEQSRHEMLFVYDHSETGKMILLKTIIGSLRPQGKVVLAVASSDIASLLLPAGRTTPYRTLRDLMIAPKTVFGRKAVILGGDFRQALPVKKVL
nr:hypothetical protein [Tanacetum cinerariifolium]